MEAVLLKIMIISIKYYGDKQMKTNIIFFLFITIILVVAGCKDDKESEDNNGNLGVSLVEKSNADSKTKWDSLVYKIDENSELQSNIKQMYIRDFQKNPPSYTREILQELNNLLHDPNANPSAAKSTLEFFVAVDAKDVIRESLMNPIRDVPGWDLIIIASESVTSSEDKMALPNIINVLTNNNYLQEGSESATIHQRMKRELIESIKSITKLDIDVDKLNINDPEQIENILSHARDWAHKHNLTLLDEKQVSSQN